MCRMYATFDQLLAELSNLSERRRLFGEELYQAVLLMGLLTMHCYEMDDPNPNPNPNPGAADGATDNALL